MVEVGCGADGWAECGCGYSLFVLGLFGPKVANSFVLLSEWRQLVEVVF